MNTADKIFFGGTILTMDPLRPRVEALAISGEKIISAGALSDILALAGPNTLRENLQGRTLMPGLFESHTHALWGACRDLFQIYMGYQATLDEIAQALHASAVKLPKGTWLSGGPWRYEMTEALGMSPKEWLDTIAPHNPVALSDTTQHALWCNSPALVLAGLDDATADIKGGVIGRDSKGGLNGFLAECACTPVLDKLKWTNNQLDQACGYAMRYFNSLGYTAFKEPAALNEDLAAYARAADKNALTLHAGAHIAAFSPLAGETLAIDALCALRTEFTRTGLNLNFSKLFLDGVAPAYTASFLRPYLPRPGYDPATHDPDATLLLTPDEIARMVAEHDRHGFCVKMHAVGDNAARKGLDAIAHARAQNGKQGPRHEIAHCAFIDDDDLPRFSYLNAVAEVSPKLWMPNAATPAQVAVLGADRLSQVHRIKSLLDHGADVIFGSDWPASAPDANPWTGLSGMISRTDPSGIFAGSVAPEQAISLEKALPLFTTNAARALGLEHETGQIRKGFSADYIILHEDLTKQSPEEIGATEVQRTVFKGKSVFEQN